METQKSGTESTSGRGGRKRTRESPPISSSSAGPSSGSKQHWQKPGSVMELAAQANDVATKFLNGEVNIEVARTYATIARVVAQAASIEVAKSRFLKEEPDLSL